MALGDVYLGCLLAHQSICIAFLSISLSMLSFHQHRYNDNFKEFFSLLQRIASTEKSRQYNLQETTTKCIKVVKVKDAKVVTSQVMWRPSFEWEDLLPCVNRTFDIDSKTDEQDLKGREHEQERVLLEASLENDRSLDSI